jgi:hypothetical protein
MGKDIFMIKGNGEVSFSEGDEEVIMEVMEVEAMDKELELPVVVGGIFGTNEVIHFSHSRNRR